MHGPDDSGHEMERISTAEGQGQDAIENKQKTSFGKYKKYPFFIFQRSVKPNYWGYGFI